ncbi:hypothetical protein CHLNCDRAFT_136556 [Chlorella variabilis]|uniref:Sulfotransferase n=1 Tax=Chlorella variabilis TaxID=554065 RepID=E1ZKL4_CHLVA|nr:hypothetical protein CHLNCDRAFT_136556 [Chlorella variabilis]EFN53714.1 hypothetical protein CHLNCDRAFT_136556 [Chlorella variabilis]|eukprot:XP_005845816.1 hypothetical protein CHLNCDRAFT_136556 [Chlorella variabilis]
MGPARTPPKRPRLLTSLGAWVVVASLLCLHRATRDVTKSLSHDEIESLIRQPATLHGVVQKGGLPANYSFMVAHLTDTNPDVREEGIPATMGPALMRWFAHAYTFNRSMGHSNYHLQSPVPACHFWADHRYRILYVRNFKTAGTSITVTLGQKELHMYCKANPANCAAKCRNKQVCLENIIDQAVLRKLFAEYTVFSFVRNPWARALSSWHHVHKHGLHPPCQDPFTKFAQLPSAYGAKCLGDRSCCKRRFGWLLEHLEPQSTCLFDDRGRPSVDFLGRVENLDEDMQELVKLVNSRLGEGVEPLRVGSLPRWQLALPDMKDRQDELWRYYAELYYNTLQDIRSYFHADFDLLQFPGRDMVGRGGGGVAAEAAATISELG